jgi:lipopolysaccharide export system permease protein
MKLLDRYVVRQYVRTFVMLVVGIPLLFVVGDITDNIDKYMDRHVTGARLALSYVYQFPLFMQYAFPIAALVATVFTIGSMTRHQEISAAKAGGVSFYRLVAPIVLLAVALSFAAFGLGELAPVTLQKRAALVGEARETNATSRNNFVYQTEEEGVLTARRLDAVDKQMWGVVLERNASATGPGMHRLAETAGWTRAGGWVLRNGYIRTLTADGGEKMQRFDSVKVPGLHETPEELLAEPKDPTAMRYGEVKRFVQAIERSGGDANPLKVELAQKLALPCAVLIIVLFGAPLATSSQRGGAAYGIGISLGVTILYMLLFRVGKAFGSSGSVDPVLAAWAPNGLFLLAGLVLLGRTRT